VEHSPDELEHPFFPNLNIDAVSVDGRPAPLTGKLTLDASSSRLEIGYEPVLLRSQEGLRFRYKLDGMTGPGPTQARSSGWLPTPSSRRQLHILVEAWRRTIRLMRPAHRLD